MLTETLLCPFFLYGLAISIPHSKDLQARLLPQGIVVPQGLTNSSTGQWWKQNPCELHLGHMQRCSAEGKAVWMSAPGEDLVFSA